MVNSVCSSIVSPITSPKLFCAACPEMVVISSGSFQMGSPGSESGRYDYEGPVHRVSICSKFALGKYEVTRGQYAAFVRDTGRGTGDGCRYWTGTEVKFGPSISWRETGYSQTDSHPVTCVNWEDAKAYAMWLSRKTGKSYRLPSEAEWEYAARAGTTAARYWGSSSGQAYSHENVNDRTAKRVNNFPWDAHDCDDGHGQTSPVGRFRSNSYGLYDVLGNVLEWVEDGTEPRHDD